MLVHQVADQVPVPSDGHVLTELRLSAVQPVHESLQRVGELA